MRHSIFQENPVRSRGDYEMINIDHFISFIEELGFSPIIENNKGNYTEQSYTEKTLTKKTAFHGQFRLNFTNPNKDLGLTLFSSSDCQLPFMLFAGPVYKNDVLPFKCILNIKHTKSDIDKVEAGQLRTDIGEAILKVQSILNSWKKEPVRINQIISTFNKTNEYKTSLMKGLAMRSLDCSNKFELFMALVRSFVYGEGKTDSGRKPKKLKHLRRHLQLINFIIQVLG